MKEMETVNSDAAAVAYIQTCLRGRAIRISRKWSSIADHEQLTLNAPIYEDSNEEGVNLIGDDRFLFENILTNKLILQQAMDELTRKEAHIITELFLHDKKISQLSTELHVSRNTINKTKKKAIMKLKKFI